MSRKVIPFIIAIPGLFLIFMCKIIPAVNTLLISFKDYKIVKGTFGSQWVGINNYKALLQSVAFRNILNNTLALNSFSIIITAIFALALIVCIVKMPDKWCKLCAIAILSIPAFIPISSFIGVFMKAFSVNSGFINKIITSSGNEPVLFFGDKALYPLLFAMMDSIRNIFVPVIIGVLICENSRKFSFKSIAIVLAGYIAARVTMLLSPDIELLYMSYSPLVYETADVFDTYSLRTGLMTMQLGSGSTAWVIKTIIQLFINIALYFLLAVLVPKISESVKDISNKVNRSMDSFIAILGYLFLASGSLAVIILTFIPVSNDLSEGIKLLISNKPFITAVFNSLLYSIFGSIVYGFITITLSYPLTVKTKIYPLILIIVISLINNFTGEYLIFKSMGTINTIFPVIFGTGLSVIGPFALYFSISGRFGDDIPGIGQYLKEAILPLIVIVVLSFIANWGGYIYQLLFLSNTNLRGIGLLGMQIMTIQDNGNRALYPATPVNFENVKAAFFFISSIIPATIGTALIIMSKYLPLSAFVSQTRKS